ncbi:MAG: ATP-binding cassette domain-containing protein [Bacteroidaceae bacterium]|nr:ATP-binding cassette domain-containing protein [Bacteroidaceae bacterium]MDY4998997.1 ATP-binding cassette domain-containing protein [Bacteroidaceae bacterium]MDY5688101.1 ATP-binding cassette domain-containing protein [Bacteroidaceae bacterium]
MIDISNVTFEYRKGKPVLKDFSLSFPQGGVYGLLGKNGTGKSTLLYLISGLLRPRHGEVRVDGMLSANRQPEMLREIFLVPEEYDLPSVSLKSYTRALKSFYPRFSDELLRKCIEVFDLEMDMQLGTLSMGQKKKVYMCVALATGTRVLLMDEPTNGLDILSKSQFRKVVVQGMEEDKTVLVSTHQVHDVERLLDHVTIINGNQVLLHGPLNEDNGPVDLEKLFIETVEGIHTSDSDRQVIIK